MDLDIYTTCFILGMLLILISFIFNFLGDLDFGGDVDVDMDLDTDVDFDLDGDLDMDGDIDLDGDGHADPTSQGLSPISPLMVGMLLMFFGMGGALLENEFDSRIVLMGAAMVVGIAGMLTVRKLMNVYFYESQGDSNIRDVDLIGKEASVTITIRNGKGQVVMPTTLGRELFTAKCDRNLPRGTPVKVLKKVGPLLIVESLVDVPETPAVEEAKTPGGNPGRTGGEGEKETCVGSGKNEKKDFDKTDKKAAHPTIVYDQRKVVIKDSVINKSNISELSDEYYDDHGDAENKMSAAEKMLEKERSALEQELLGDIPPAGDEETDTHSGDGMKNEDGEDRPEKTEEDKKE